MNWRLAVLLAWRSLWHHRTVALATVAGVALGMAVVAAILIVDHHSTQAGIPSQWVEYSGGFAGQTAAGQPTRLHIHRVHFERQGQNARTGPAGAIPTQESRVGQELSRASPPDRRGEEDYQAMRLAVRLSSLLAFAVGAVIVFYTMRFSVISRSREFCLLLCLGESRASVVWTLVLETLALGGAGTALGCLLALPAGLGLIRAGISTTGRMPASDFSPPWAELVAMGGLSVAVALLAVAGPARAIAKVNIVEVLQPRFLSHEIDESSLNVRGFGWLIPPLLVAAWLAMRPFLQTWLSVVHFFLLESFFASAFALAVLWWMNPLLRALIKVFGWVLRPLLPLEALLAGRRMKLTSQKLVFTIAGVALVFSLLTCLHDITRSLKQEIRLWSEEALSPYLFFRQSSALPDDPEAFKQLLVRHRLYFFRLSEKIKGEFPIRLMAAADVNPYLQARGKPLLLPGTVIVSRTLAQRFGLKPKDAVVIEDGQASHRFVVADVSDEVGFFVEDGQYVDLKSYLLFSDGNPLFAGNLERSLGRYGVVRHQHSGGFPSHQAIVQLKRFYVLAKEGHALQRWQQQEIDRDFLIFDFILAMTILLAALGVANNLLIQVHQRRREFSVLRTLGVSKAQMVKLLLVEAALIGLVAALLALLLGHLLGAISVSFLDRFTLFDYRFVWSWRDALWMAGLAVSACCLAAIYPALAANQVSSAESLHYE